MATQQIFAPRRELAHRTGPGLEVTLFWDVAENTTSIEIWHALTGETLHFAVPNATALDAFYHPLAYLQTADAA